MGEYIFNIDLPAGIVRTAETTNTFTNTLTGTKKPFRKIGFISGGSGITPTLQVVEALIADPKRNFDIWILFANQTEADILCRPQLDACEKDPRVKVWYTV